jgi:hypothetical protein
MLREVVLNLLLVQLNFKKILFMSIKINTARTINLATQSGQVHNNDSEDNAKIGSNTLLDDEQIDNYSKILLEVGADEDKVAFFNEAATRYKEFKAQHSLFSSGGVKNPLLATLIAVMECLDVSLASLLSQSCVMTSGRHIAEEFNKSQQAFSDLNSVSPFTWQDKDGKSHTIGTLTELFKRYIGIQKNTDEDFNQLSEQAKLELKVKFGHVSALYNLLGEQDSTTFPMDISKASADNVTDDNTSEAVNNLVAKLNMQAAAVNTTQLPSPIRLNGAEGVASTTAFDADSLGKICESLSKAITVSQNVNQQQSLLLQQNQTAINSWCQIGGNVLSNIKEAFQNAQAR